MASVKTYLQRIKNLKLKNPLVVGFGIKDKTTFEQACENAHGAIIGTAFIKALENDTNAEKATKNFLNEIIC
jgi:tryptophan synthase alpha chain